MRAVNCDWTYLTCRFLPHAEGRKSRNARDDPVLRESGQESGGSFTAAFVRKSSSANSLGVWDLSLQYDLAYV